MDRVEDLWNQFRTNHDELAQHEDELIISEYFSTRKFENIQGKHEAMTAKIEQLLQELQPPENLIENLASNTTNIEQESEQSGLASDDD